MLPVENTILVVALAFALTCRARCLRYTLPHVAPTAIAYSSSVDSFASQFCTGTALHVLCVEACPVALPLPLLLLC